MSIRQGKDEVFQCAPDGVRKRERERDRLDRCFSLLINQNIPFEWATMLVVVVAATIKEV